jgi:HdeA/HdeB family
MKLLKTALVAGSLLFVLTARIAAEGQAVLGQGNVSCSSWLENHTSDDARAAWILGYITGFNQYGSKPESDVSEGTTTEKMMVWIDNYCRNHPADNLYRRRPRSLMSSGRNPGASEANSRLICALRACNHPCAGAFACKDIISLSPPHLCGQQRCEV